MALNAGTRIGAYEIVAAVGAGGMGEVYRARDTKLNRDAAIKVLPAAFARDADGVARLRREAQVLASLNHPHIASIHGLEETKEGLALALEFVEGDDLARRLARGAIPVDEAIAYARQIVDALEAAHEKGIVHRDLKPANVKVTNDGAVKVLDFGLAKAYDGDVTPAGTDPTQSPTITRYGATEAGVIMGTAAYMSPEQARGRPVDKRSDIWAFGVVLYEMLTGRPLFPGETSSDTLAGVLTREIDWTKLPSTTPPGVRRLLTRCLERDPRKRLRDIGDARPDLEETRGATSLDPSVRRGAFLGSLPWALAAAAALLAVWAVWGRTGLATTSPDVTELDLAFPPDLEPLTPTTAGLAISPDGPPVSMAPRFRPTEAASRSLPAAGRSSVFLWPTSSGRLSPPAQIWLADSCGVRRVSSSTGMARCGSSHRTAVRPAHSRCSMPAAGKSCTITHWSSQGSGSSCSRA